MSATAPTTGVLLEPLRAATSLDSLTNVETWSSRFSVLAPGTCDTLLVLLRPLLLFVSAREFLEILIKYLIP